MNTSMNAAHTSIIMRVTNTSMSIITNIIMTA